METGGVERKGREKYWRERAKEKEREGKGKWKEGIKTICS